MALSKKFFRKKFSIRKWKWYIVDLTDFHKPVVIRKHFSSKEQANWVRDTYFNKDYYDVVDWKTAQEFGLRDYKVRSRGHPKHVLKYNYPKRCVTPSQKMIFRVNKNRKMRKDKRLPKVTLAAIWDLIDDKPMLLMKRLKAYRRNYWIVSEPVEGVRVWREKHDDDFKNIKDLCNIVRVLRRYYDLGLYNVVEVTEFIHKKWKKRIEKYSNKDSNPTNLEKIEKEFRARGFVDKSEVDFDYKTDSWVETINLPVTLVYPELCWFNYKDKEIYDYKVYELQSRIGIPGYTKACVAGIK